MKISEKSLWREMTEYKVNDFKVKWTDGNCYKISGFRLVGTTMTFEVDRNDYKKLQKIIKAK